MFSIKNELKDPGYQRVYRLVGFSLIGFVDAVISVALSRALGVVGLLLPSVLIGIAYFFVVVGLDFLIFFLELRNGSRGID